MSDARDNEPESSVQTGSGKRKQGIGRFFRFSMIYALGDVLTKGVQILLVPYYLSVLTPAEVGMLAVLTTIFFAAWTTMSFGLGFAVRRYYHDHAQQGDQFTSSVWAFRFLFGLPAFGLMVLVMSNLLRWSDSTIPWALVLMALTSGFLKGGLNVIESWFMIREEPVKYRTFSFLQFLTNTCLIIALVSGLGWGVYGAVMGDLISYSIWTIVSGYLLFRRAWPSFGSVNWNQVFWYCLPVLPHALFMWGMAAADRLILEHYVGLDEIGVYDTGYKLAAFLSVVIMAMRAAWLPDYFKTADDEGAVKKYASMATIFSYIVFYAALGGILFAPEGIQLASFAAIGNYSQAVAILRIVALGFVGLGMFIVFNQPLLYRQRTGWVAIASGSGLAINVLTNLLLIPNYGIVGSAIATVISYAAMATIMLVMVNKLYGFTWETATLCFFAAAAVIFGGLGCLLDGNPWSGSTAVRLVLFLLFPAVTLFRLQRDQHSNLTLKLRFSLLNSPVVPKSVEIAR